MRYLTRPAAAAFLGLVRRSYALGIISWTEFVERLRALRQLCRPGSPEDRAAERVLRTEEYFEPDEWPEEDDAPPGAAAARTSARDTTGAEDDDDNGYLYFAAANIPGMNVWEFHVYDDDFFPSVPHGHHLNHRRQKLDAYAGWIYQGNRQLSRESRKRIVALWNDSDFRRVASASIQYYLEHHPGYSGWSVSNPRRLPRRR